MRSAPRKTRISCLSVSMMMIIIIIIIIIILMIDFVEVKNNKNSKSSTRMWHVLLIPELQKKNERRLTTTRT